MSIIMYNFQINFVALYFRIVSHAISQGCPYFPRATVLGKRPRLYVVATKNALLRRQGDNCTFYARLGWTNNLIEIIF